MPRRRRLQVDGVLLLDKPLGITSQSAVARVKALFNAAKAGHTGTLDPMASGLLPIALGEATKFSSVLLDAAKGYLATVRLGITTTTGDLEGAVTSSAPVEADIVRIEDVLPQFTGTIAQVPPMYSALKFKGKPLYQYARAGTHIERAPRQVTIEELVLEDYTAPDLRLRVRCSKGTYIRVLAEDIGQALGCGACLAALRRIESGRFVVSDAVQLDVLGSMAEPERVKSLLSVDVLLSGLPEVELDSKELRRIVQGQSVPTSVPEGALVRIYGPDRAFMGIAEAVGMGFLQPRRLVAGKTPTG